MPTAKELRAAKARNKARAARRTKAAARAPPSAGSAPANSYWRKGYTTKKGKSVAGKWVKYPKKK